MGWFDRAKKSDRYDEMTDEEKEDMAKYANDREGWVREQRANIAHRNIRHNNENTADYYDTDADDSSNGSNYTTDYSEYGDLSDQ